MYRCLDRPGIVPDCFSGDQFVCILSIDGFGGQLSFFGFGITSLNFGCLRHFFVLFF